MDSKIAKEFALLLRHNLSAGGNILSHPVTLGTSVARVERIWGNTVRIQTDSGVGSGFCIKTDVGILIATNAHVVGIVDSCSYRYLKGPFYHTKQARLVAIDYPHDLALLQPVDEESKADGLEIGGPPLPGQAVDVCGFPHGCETPRLLQGCVSGYECRQTIEEMEVTTVVIQAPVNIGCSGGPVCDEAGNVVGVVYAKDNPFRNVPVPKRRSKSVEALLEGLAANLIATDGLGYALDPTDLAKMVECHVDIARKQTFTEISPKIQELPRADFVQLQRQAALAPCKPADCSPLGVYHYSPETGDISLGWKDDEQVALDAPQSCKRLFGSIAPGGGHFLLKGYDVLQYRKTYRGWIVPRRLVLT